ncbi:MAG: hypothetical protein K2X81_25885 [Candidatus Obscuribacterales bacterium]|nr:hypothetical protein [Candidatus Obscuribacterales bacterium]
MTASNSSALKQNLNRLELLAEQACLESGFVLVDLRLSQQGKSRSLEVAITKTGSRVSLDDCELVSKKLDALIEAQQASEDPILEGSFLLEVQSPGIERVLKTKRELAVFAGQRVHVKTKQPIAGLGASFFATLGNATSDDVSFQEIEKDIVKGKSKKTATNQAETTPTEFNMALKDTIEIKLSPDTTGSLNSDTAIS